MTPEEQLINDILVLEEKKIFLNPLNQEIHKAQKEDRDKLTMRQLKAVTEYASIKAEEGMRKAFEAGVSSVVIARTTGRPIHLKMTRRFDEWYTKYKLSQI